MRLFALSALGFAVIALAACQQPEPEPAPAPAPVEQAVDTASMTPEERTAELRARRAQRQIEAQMSQMSVEPAPAEK